jgi:peptide-methionine (S)-S-oxide reductase
MATLRPILRSGATRRVTMLAAGAVLAAALALGGRAAASEEGRAIPPPAAELQEEPTRSAVAVVAGGCFWGIQGVFQHVEGVTNAVSGYAGGDQAGATYKAVSSGRTRHAEAVRITYDPARISYGRILQIFFSVGHDPTQLDRQGPDVGAHYRSAIFPQNKEQASVAAAYIAQLDEARTFSARIATRIEAGQAFYPAEAYHQDYMARNPRQPYIAINDLPKVENLKRLFPALYRAQPQLVSMAAR